MPFHIPTTCGQQKSLPWIKSSWIESPHNKFGVAVRMALEILLFRSLFRNTRAQTPSKGPGSYTAKTSSSGWGHWHSIGPCSSFVLRHLRFFVEPMPRFVLALEAVDGFFQIGAPRFLVTDVVIVAALLFLLQRRFANPQSPLHLAVYRLLWHCSFSWALPFPESSCGTSSEWTLKASSSWPSDWLLFRPSIPASVGPLFFVHLTLVSVLLAYFPFSKLVHMGGIFLSPTRNLANDSRMRRHVNPWDYPVKVHTYQEWEEEFHDKIKAAGLPLEKGVGMPEAPPKPEELVQIGYDLPRTDWRDALWIIARGPTPTVLRRRMSSTWGMPNPT